MAFTTAQHSSYWTQERSLVPRLDGLASPGAGATTVLMLVPWSMLHRFISLFQTKSAVETI